MFDSQNRPFLPQTWSKMNPQRAKIAEPGPAQWDGYGWLTTGVVPLCSLNRIQLVRLCLSNFTMVTMLVIYRTSFHGIITHL